MTFGLRLFLFFAVILLALLGILTVFEVLPPDQLSNISTKLILTLLILGFAGGALTRVSSLGKSKKEANRNSEQGPQF